MKKNTKIYDLIDNLPIWQHLLNNGFDYHEKLETNDYGRFAEIVGQRFLERETSKEGGLLLKLFPDTKILRVKRLDQNIRRLGDGSLYTQKHFEYIGDRVIQLDCGKKGGKKIAVFEIKCGHVHIRQNQLKLQCNAILYPETFIERCKEVKVFYLIFNEIDTKAEFASLELCELTKEFATRILNQKELRNGVKN